MSRRLLTVVRALYPRAWRQRYAAELSDLCEEVVNAGETTQLRLASALATAALRERLRSAWSSRRFAVLGASASVVVALGLVTFATNGFGVITASVPTTPAQSVLLHLGPGRAGATSSINEPKGAIVMASISAPRGIHVSADAYLPGTANVAITTAPGAGSTVSCRTHGSENVCTESFEWCPMPAFDWQVDVIKQSGPAAEVRVALVVGPKSLAL